MADKQGKGNKKVEIQKQIEEKKIDEEKKLAEMEQEMLKKPKGSNKKQHGASASAAAAAGNQDNMQEVDMPKKKLPSIVVDEEVK